MLESCSVCGSEAAGKRPGGGALSSSAGAADGGWPLDAIERDSFDSSDTQDPHESTTNSITVRPFYLGRDRLQACNMCATRIPSGEIASEWRMTRSG